MSAFALKKIVRNKWMYFCLIIGSIVFIAVISGIINFTNGLSQYMLLRDVGSLHLREESNPGVWSINIPIKNEGDVEDGFLRANWFRPHIKGRYAPAIGLPVLASRSQYDFDRFFYDRLDTGRPRTVYLTSYEDLWDHVDFVGGRVPETGANDGVLEFAMSVTDYQFFEFNLNEPFDLKTYSTTDRFFSIAMCVGVFQPRIEDPYWFPDHEMLTRQPSASGTPTLFIDFDYVVERFVEPETVYLDSFTAYCSFDYMQIRSDELSRILGALNTQRAELRGNGTMTFALESTLRTFLERRDFLELMLWTLKVPVILILVFYIYMVSQLMIKNDSNEIAVMKSRGARNVQILLIYAITSLLIAIVSIAAGVPLGLLLCQLLGLSNGFMEIVMRQRLPLELTQASFIYAAAAAAGFVVIMIIPALVATRDTIVESKRKKSRRVSAPLWQKFCIDLVLIAVSLYGLYSFAANAELRALVESEGMSAPIDPLMLISSSLFVMGAGLLFVRLFPLLVKLIFITGKKVWSPQLFATLLSISRFRGSSQFLTLFLVFSVGLGLFNATMARTLNRFLEERIRYENGADISLTQVWQTEMYAVIVHTDDGLVTYERIRYIPGGGVPLPTNSIGPFTNAIEPPFDRFSTLSGVSSATRVFNREEAMITNDTRRAYAEVIGIVPHEFGKIAWFRDDLLSTHINNYLNLMTYEPSTVFLSTSLRDEYDFSIGDTVWIRWDGQPGAVEGMVHGFVDYWPSVNPVLQPYFIIANLDTIHQYMRVEQYSVWISLEEGATSEDLYTSINDENIRLTRFNDTRQELIAVKSDPLMRGINGSLTLGFIVTLFVTFIGFLIYWILSIRSRLLQFGILRSLGLSKSKVMSAIIWEQLLVSGSAAAAGFGVGVLTSNLFVPTLQLMYPVSEQIPPFRASANWSDLILLLSTVGVMLIVGLFILTMIIRRLKVDQILKLGED